MSSVNKNMTYGLIFPSHKEKKYGEEKCSLCGKNFPVHSFERNMFCWASKHTETVTYDQPSWICPNCKKELNSLMTDIMNRRRSK